MDKNMNNLEYENPNTTEDQQMNRIKQIEEPL